MKNLKETIKTIIREESEYQQFFKKALEKSGKSISQMSDEEKKAFFNKIDTAWDGKGEKNEGNAFGAAVVKAKEAGKDEFKVGGKTYKVESVNEAKKYDIGMGRLGNGVTVYNRAEEQWGDYKTIAHIGEDGTVKYYDKSLPSNIKKMIEKHASKMKESVRESVTRTAKKIEGVNEVVYDQKVKEVIHNSTSSFKNLGNDFKKAGLKYNFSTTPFPHYIVEPGRNKKVAVIHRKNEYDIKKSGIKYSTYIATMKESVNESKYNKDLDKIEAAVKNAKSFMGVGAELKKAGIKYDFTTSMIPMYMVKVPGNTIAIVNKKYAAGAEREVGDTAIGLLEGIVKEGKFKSGDKVTISYPTMIKPLKGVVSMVLNASGNEVLVLKGDAGVWDAKFATLNEGNAFGAAVTAAKQEGKKEFEFNGKTYKIKKGSYEKNESAKKVNEAIDVEYWEDYGGKSPKVTSSAKVKSIVDSAVDEWNSDADSSNMVNSNSRNKILKLATEFFKSSGYIAYDIVMAMIMQES